MCAFVFLKKIENQTYKVESISLLATTLTTRDTNQYTHMPNRCDIVCFGVFCQCATVIIAFDTSVLFDSRFVLILSLLSTHVITNLSRSKNAAFEIMLRVDVNTPNADIESLRKEICRYVQVFYCCDHILVALVIFAGSMSRVDLMNGLPTLSNFV